MLLGEMYTAKAIYAFYRKCRLVTLNRPKDNARVGRAPGSANVPGAANRSGMTGNALQANAIRAAEATTNRVRGRATAL